MLSRSVIRRVPSLSKATRLQLGNIKTTHGMVSTAAGSQEKWGYIYRSMKYPIQGVIFAMTYVIGWVLSKALYDEHIDRELMANHICFEDVKDRVLTPLPGWARMRTSKILSAGGNVLVYREPTPLEWLPFDLKLGHVKQASV